MVETFQEIAQNKGWFFDYGRDDFQNLHSAKIEAEFVCMLFPLQQKTDFNPYGVAKSNTYSGAFALLKPSELWEVYHSQQGTEQGLGRYQKYIEPCKHELNEFAISVSCLGLEITQWEVTEVVNFLDANFDGVWVKFQIKQQE